MPDLNLSSAVYQLGDLREVTLPLCASVFPLVKWEYQV